MRLQFRRKAFRSDSRGASLADYGIVVGLVSVVAVVTVASTGTRISDIFGTARQAVASEIATEGGTGGSNEVAGPVFDKDQYGVDDTGFLMGTPQSDTLVLSGEPGVQGLESNDDITGSSNVEIFIAGPGDDTITDTYGNDTYYYALGDGSDTVSDSHKSWFQENRFVFTDLTADEVTFGYDAGAPSDLLMTTPDGATTRLVGAASNASYAFGAMDFTDQVINTQGIMDKYVEDQKPTGEVIGGSWSQNYHFYAGDPQYTVYDHNKYDWQKSDTFTFEGFDMADVALGRSGADVTASITGENTVTFVNATSAADLIPTWNFGDGTLDPRQFRSKLVEDQKATGTVIGMGYPEDYFFRSGDPAYTISDYNKYERDKADIFTFEGFDKSDVVLAHGGGHITASIAGENTVTFLNATDGRYLFQTWTFGDATLDARQFRSKLVADQKPTGTVVGLSFPEDYTHASGDGSYSVTDINEHDWQKADTFTFEALTQDQVTFSRSGGDVVATVAGSGDQITFIDLLGYGYTRFIPTWTFSDGTLDRLAMASKIVNDQRPTGTVIGGTGQENYAYALADPDYGSFTITDSNEHDWQRADTLTFDVNSTDVVFSASGDDLVVTMSNSETITVTNGYTYGNWAISRMIFADGVELTFADQQNRVASGG